MLKVFMLLLVVDVPFSRIIINFNHHACKSKSGLPEVSDVIMTVGGKTE
jgi:hypothetical protein